MATEPREGEYMYGLLKYIDRGLSKKYTELQIKTELQRQGNTRAAIDRAFRIYSERMRKEQEARTVKKEEPKVEFEMPEVEEKKGFFARLFGL